MNDYLIKYLKEEMDRAINAPGMRVGLPKVKLDVDKVNAIIIRLERLQKEKEELNRLR